MRKRRGLSSIYGFIMIYLLVIASLQAISMSLSSGQNAEAAAQQAGQVSQQRSLERLVVTLAKGGNVSITNDGLIPSTLSYLFLENSTLSRVVELGQSIPVGGSTVVAVRASPSFPSTVAVITGLGDVFASTPSSVPPAVTGKALAAGLGGPGVDAQVYQNPSDPSRFFLSVGSSAFAYSSRGTETWSFNASQGEVTDVQPLSDGGVYVSDGYYGDQFTSNLFRLTSSGTSVQSYSMRLFRLYSALEVQFPDDDTPPSPLGSQPVQKAEDSLYSYYDGWFLNSSGISRSTVPSDTLNLLASDPSQFYFYRNYDNPGGFSCTDPSGNIAQVFAYSAGSPGVQLQWSTFVFFNVCDYYPNEVVAAASGGGTLAAVFSSTYWSQPTYYDGPYPGTNPFLALISSSTGSVVWTGRLDSSGYSSVATDGSHVYLSIPSSDQVEVLPASGATAGTFYGIGIPASSLVWADGSLFAISSGAVKVFGPGMTLEKTIEFGPLSLYSYSNSKPLEDSLSSPSFVVLNSTAYVALLRNSTGFGTLLMGSYSP
ncbi:MAG TPA: hypothetical protein VLX56_08625 [Nitrososphaerales archaeon]|nr:hypothetical protein [Nitrososphaerales archaeon]